MDNTPQYEIPEDVIERYNAGKLASESNRVAFLKKKLLHSLEKTLGNVTDACLKAKVSRKTYYKYINEDEAFKQRVNAIAEKAIDFVESKLFEKIKGVQLPHTEVFCSDGHIITHETIKHLAPDTASICFYLKTRAKHRGYIERTEVTGAEGQPLLSPTTVNLIKNLTLVELIQISEEGKGKDSEGNTKTSESGSLQA